MKEFFENLKEVREKKKISLEIISKRTRIALDKLQDIEAGNLDKLSPGYDRIFFKRYLKEIGEDKEEVWNDFNLFFGKSSNISYQAKEKTKTTANEKQAEPEKHKEPKPSIFQELSLRLDMDNFYKYFLISITLIVLSVVGYFAYQQFIFVKKNQVSIKEITVADYIERMQKQDSLTSPAAQRNPNNPGLLNVELKALERTWVREIRDGTDTTDYILPAGRSRKFSSHHSVNLMMGRADGIEVWLNGQNLGTMGKADEIVPLLLLDKNGIADKRLRKSVKQDEN